MANINKANNINNLDNLDNNNLLSIKDLSKSFNDRNNNKIVILQNANFDIKASESIAIVGPSGIGKSTLLHILGTLDKPDSGKIFFKNKDVFLLNEIELAKFRNKSIGFVFQFHYLLSEFSAIENVMIPAFINNISKREAYNKAEEILIKVELKDRLFHKVGDLSGGEQQRVAIARALILKPALLLADEPTGNLDKKTAEIIHKLLVGLNKDFGMALIIVTHNIELANYMSSRITLIDGKLSYV